MQTTTRSRADAILAATFTKVEITYKTDEQGNTIRLDATEGGVTATREEVRSFLLGKRVFDDAEALAEIGKGWTKHWASKGLVKRDARGGFYWITDRLAKAYDLPKPVVCGVTCKFPKAA